MKAVVAAFNQEKALVGAFSVITNLRMQLFEALLEDQELDNNYDEDNISFVNHSLSQQPLLNMSTFAHSHVWTLL